MAVLGYFQRLPVAKLNLKQSSMSGELWCWTRMRKPVQVQDEDKDEDKDEDEG
jgi:hypothetical protein